MKTVSVLEASVKALEANNGVAGGASIGSGRYESKTEESTGGANGSKRGAQECNYEVFKDFLSHTVGLPNYLEKFESVDCADIRMIEHFDSEFLKDTLNITNPIHIKLLSKYFKQFNDASAIFKKHLIESKKPNLKHYILQFEAKGVITWSLLSKCCTDKNSLKTMFEIENVEHLEALFGLITKYRNGKLELK